MGWWDGPPPPPPDLWTLEGWFIVFLAYVVIPGFFYGLYRGIMAVKNAEATLRRERIRKELEREAGSSPKRTPRGKRRASTVEKLLGQDEMTRLQTAFAWGPAAAFWWTARRTIVETDLCAPGAFFFAVFPPYCGWARSTQTLFLTSFFAITITLIGYTSVKFAECLEYVYEKSYGLHRLWSHFQRLVHRQRPALMAVCVLLGNIAAHRFPLLPAEKYCGHGSAFLHTRLCRSSTVWCALPAGHLLWGSHLRFSCANGGSANTWHCLSLLLGTLKYSLILQAAYALCESVLYASEDVSRQRAKRKPQRIVAERTLDCRVDGAALAKASGAEVVVRGAGDGCRVRITGTAAQVAAAKKLVQEACEASNSESEPESEPESESESESEERAAAKLRGLVEVYANFPDRPLSAADADELNRLREKTCGSEGAAKDRQAAKRLLRKRSEAAQPEAPEPTSEPEPEPEPAQPESDGVVKPVVPQGPSAADLRAERLRVARERQDALRKQTSVEESKCEEEEEPSVREGYETVARILAAVGETRLLPLFEAQEIDDVVLPSLKPTDLVDLGVSPGACLAILGPSAGKAKKIEASAEAILHDVATHQSVLEDELRHHRAEIERLRISRDELPEDLCCPITCELMKDPVITADGTTFERCAIKEWFETGARTSPTTNEPLENLTLIPNHVCKRLINALMEERSLSA
jgi:hypothetical protein